MKGIPALRTKPASAQDTGTPLHEAKTRRTIAWRSVVCSRGGLTIHTRAGPKPNHKHGPVENHYDLLRGIPCARVMYALAACLLKTDSVNDLHVRPSRRCPLFVLSCLLCGCFAFLLLSRFRYIHLAAAKIFPMACFRDANVLDTDDLLNAHVCDDLCWFLGPSALFCRSWSCSGNVMIKSTEPRAVASR